MPRRCCTSRKEARAPSRSHGNGRRKDRTNAALAIEHGIIFLERDSVDAAEAVPAPGHGVSAPALAELFLVGLTVGLRGGDQLLPIGRIDLPSVTAPREDLVFVLPVVGGRIRDLFLSKFLIIGVSFAQLFEMRTHVSRIRKFGRRAARTRARAKAGRRGARNERHAGRTCLSFGWPVGLRAMRARAMGNAHKISAAAGERTSHPASAETEPSSGSCLKHTLPA